jgi:hypothetical protein
MDSYTSDCLVENSISWGYNKVFVMRSSGGGNVIAYNYFEDGYGAGYPNYVEYGANASHETGAHFELFEGNQAFNMDADSYWGSQMYNVFWRNHSTTLRRSIAPGTTDGVQVPLTDAGNRRGIGLETNQKWFSFVGNVIGYPPGYLNGSVIGYDYPATFSPLPQGHTFTYEWLGGPLWQAGSDTTNIWQIGYDDVTWSEIQDATVQALVLRDGNYDFFTHSVHWHGIGGTGASGPPGPPLPASLYLSSKPAFWGGTPWPWVDGSNASTPLPGTLPARTRFDLGTPNTL